MTAPTATPSPREALDILKLLADDTRWTVLRALRLSDYQAGELAEHVQLPQNLVSYHLGLLRQAGIVHTHRSEADARVLYYSLDLPAMQAALQLIGADLHLSLAPRTQHVPGGIVVFLCTGNTARSQMAEGWLRQLSQGRVPVRSAGTQPRNLHPLAVRAMAEAGVDIGYQRAKPISEISMEQPAVVITVCDRAREVCAAQLTAPVQLHWSIPDPVRADEQSPEALAVFRSVRDDVRVRVEGLLAALPSLTPAP